MKILSFRSFKNLASIILISLILITAFSNVYSDDIPNEIHIGAELGGLFNFCSETADASFTLSDSSITNGFVNSKSNNINMAIKLHFYFYTGSVNQWIFGLSSELTPVSSMFSREWKSEYYDSVESIDNNDVIRTLEGFANNYDFYLVCGYSFPDFPLIVGVKTGYAVITDSAQDIYTSNGILGVDSRRTLNSFEINPWIKTKLTFGRQDKFEFSSSLTAVLPIYLSAREKNIFILDYKPGYMLGIEIDTGLSYTFSQKYKIGLKFYFKYKHIFSNKTNILNFDSFEIEIIYPTNNLYFTGMFITSEIILF